MKYQRTKSSIFLMEIILNLLLFSILCVCSLQFFSKSFQLTEKTTTLHHAVTACSNVAAIYESGHGDMDIIYESYPYALRINDQIMIYFDENYTPCDREASHYYLLVEQETADIPKIHIQFFKHGEDASYSISACNYKPLTPASFLGGDAYE